MGATGPGQASEVLEGSGRVRARCEPGWRRGPSESGCAGDEGIVAEPHHCTVGQRGWAPFPTGLSPSRIELDGGARQGIVGGTHHAEGGKPGSCPPPSPAGKLRLPDFRRSGRSQCHCGDGEKDVPDFGVRAARLSLCKRETEHSPEDWLGHRVWEWGPETHQSQRPSPSFTPLRSGLC